MPLSTEEAARLAQLQAARDKLISGTNVTSIQEGASRTQFGTGNPDDLLAEIEKLEAKQASKTGRVRGALTFGIGHRPCW